MTAGQRREMVLQAALIEFAARGLDGVSTRDIARRAGISQPYLFRLFPTKKALFVSLVRRCFRQVEEVLATAAAGRSGEDALQAIGNAFGQLCTKRTLPLIQSSAQVLLSIVPRHAGAVAPAPQPQATQQEAPAPVSAPVHQVKAKSIKHGKKSYGAGERRALDRLFEATGNGGGDKP